MYLLLHYIFVWLSLLLKSSRFREIKSLNSFQLLLPSEASEPILSYRNFSLNYSIFEIVSFHVDLPYWTWSSLRSLLYFQPLPCHNNLPRARDVCQWLPMSLVCVNVRHGYKSPPMQYQWQQQQSKQWSKNQFPKPIFFIEHITFWNACFLMFYPLPRLTITFSVLKFTWHVLYTQHTLAQRMNCRWWIMFIKGMDKKQSHICFLYALDYL